MPLRGLRVWGECGEIGGGGDFWVWGGGLDEFYPAAVCLDGRGFIGDGDVIGDDVFVGCGDGGFVEDLRGFHEPEVIPVDK